MTARRVLITGLSSALGGRLAQILERDAAVGAVIGIDTEDPRHELQRTEYVRVGIERRALERIIAAAAIDTVIDTRLGAGPLLASAAAARELAVTATGELLAACAAAGSTVGRLVFTSSASYYGWRAGGPAFLTEEVPAPGGGQGAVQQAIVAAERAVADFAERRPHCRVAVLRPAEVIGGELRGSLLALLSLPVVPGILGFDPRLALLHFDDLVAALAHAAGRGLAGAYNVAADGVLVLSEVASLLGRPFLPVLPPWGPGFAARQLGRLGLRGPAELLHELRYGRAVDNRRLKATGFTYGYTAREAVLELRAQQRLHPLLGRGETGYRYDPDLEEFLRWSPSVHSAAATPRAHAPGERAPAPPRGEGAGAAQTPYDGLAAGELIDLIPSLEPEAVRVLHEYEAAHQRRPAVLDALERTLQRGSG